MKSVSKNESFVSGRVQEFEQAIKIKAIGHRLTTIDVHQVHNIINNEIPVNFFVDPQSIKLFEELGYNKILKTFCKIPELKEVMEDNNVILNIDSNTEKYNSLESENSSVITIPHKQINPLNKWYNPFKEMVEELLFELCNVANKDIAKQTINFLVPALQKTHSKELAKEHALKYAASYSEHLFNKILDNHGAALLKLLPMSAMSTKNDFIKYRENKLNILNELAINKAPNELMLKAIKATGVDLLEDFITKQFISLDYATFAKTLASLTNNGITVKKLPNNIINKAFENCINNISANLIHKKKLFDLFEKAKLINTKFMLKESILFEINYLLEKNKLSTSEKTKILSALSNNYKELLTETKEYNDNNTALSNSYFIFKELKKITENPEYVNKVLTKSYLSSGIKVDMLDEQFGKLVAALIHKQSATNTSSTDLAQIIDKLFSIVQPSKNYSLQEIIEKATAYLAAKPFTKTNASLLQEYDFTEYYKHLNKDSKYLYKKTDQELKSILKNEFSNKLSSEALPFVLKYIKDKGYDTLNCYIVDCASSNDSYINHQAATKKASSCVDELLSNMLAGDKLSIVYRSFNHWHLEHFIMKDNGKITCVMFDSVGSSIDLMLTNLKKRDLHSTVDKIYLNPDYIQSSTSGCLTFTQKFLQYVLKTDSKTLLETIEKLETKEQFTDARAKGYNLPADGLKLAQSMTQINKHNDILPGKTKIAGKDIGHEATLLEYVITPRDKYGVSTPNITGGKVKNNLSSYFAAKYATKACDVLRTMDAIEILDLLKEYSICFETNNEDLIMGNEGYISDTHC